MFVSFNPPGGNTINWRADAGNPPVRFGGRGGRKLNRSSLPLSYCRDSRYLSGASVTVNS
jgi:hypothetical protein